MKPLPSGWAQPLLGELCLEVRNGISTKPDQPSGLPILRISAVRPMKLDLTDTRYLPLGLAGVDSFALQANDLLFTRYNGNRELVGVCALVPPLDQRVVYPDKLIRVRLNEAAAFPRFIEKAVHSVVARGFIAEKVKTSAGQVGISGKDLKSTPVPLAPLAEQKRIADKLDVLLARVDACRQRLERVPAILKRFRQSVLAAATSGELTREWREERGISAPWTEATLGAVGDVTGGITKNRGRVNASLSKPYLRVANVYANRLDLAEIAEIATTPEEYARTCLRPGDVLVVEGNGSIDQIGRAAIWRGEVAGCTHQNHLIRWRTRGSVVSEFALYWLLSPQGRASLVELASSSAGLFTLSLSKVSSVPLQVPSLDEQNEVVRRVGTLLAMIDNIQSQVDGARSRLGRVGPAILAKAFRGELVPQDPNDEPASVMLERVRVQRAASQGAEKPKAQTRSPERSKPRVAPGRTPPKKRRAS